MPGDACDSIRSHLARGAPWEGGSRLVATVTAKTKKAKTAMPRKATIPLQILRCDRRTPAISSTVATRKRIKLTHGMSRVIGHR